MTISTRNNTIRIITAFRCFDGRSYQQQCATQTAARSCMNVFRSDPTIEFAIAYYTDERGAFEMYVAD
jgi:hypothetical protein